MLRPDQVLLFADDNSTAFERRIIDERGVEEVRLAQVAADPAARRARVLSRGGRAASSASSIHVDVDVLDYLDLPHRREHPSKRGAPFYAARVRTERTRRRAELGGVDDLRSQPDHGELDGSTLRAFNEGLADVLSEAMGGSESPVTGRGVPSMPCR